MLEGKLHFKIHCFFMQLWNAAIFICTFSILKFIAFLCSKSRGGGGGGRWVLRILRDGDDQRIFWGLKFSILGFFEVGKFAKYFLGSLI